MYPNYSPSPAARAGGINKKLLIGIIGGSLALIVAVGLMVLNSSGGNGELMARVVARHNALLGTASEAQKKIVGAELRRINSDAVLFMTSDASLLDAALQQFGVKQIPKEIAAMEADGNTAERLTAADASGRFDDTYQTILSQKIDAHQALITEATGKIDTPSVRASLKATYEHLESVQQQLEKL